MILIYIGALCVLVLVYYYGSQRKYNYWKKQKVHVPGPRPTPIFGNYKDYILLKKLITINVDEICKQFANSPIIGVFYGNDPTLIVQDPEILKLILTKDFYYFHGREVTRHTHKETFTQNLFFGYGDRWKVVRQNLTPIFSSSKMKNMFYLVANCCHELENLLDREAISSSVEVRSLMARYTIDAISACVFGVDANVMKSSENNQFRAIADAMFDNTYFRGFKYATRAVWPGLFYSLGFTAFPKFLDNFFINLTSSVFEERQYKPSPRNDFVDLILNFKTQKYLTGDAMINMKEYVGKKVDIEVDNVLLAAQSLVFFGAGFETSSTTSSFILYELAKNQDAQDRAYNEIVEYLKNNNNKISYSCVTDLPYLEACTNEALRLYPVLGNLTREVMEDYTLPNGVFLKKGTRVHIPVYSLQRNENYFANPLEYHPERFLGDQKHEIKPYTYMPFGEGPRICIGMRFARMQMMGGLVTVLKKYKLELADDMKPEVQFEAKSLVTQPVGGIRLKLTPRQGWEEQVYNK